VLLLFWFCFCLALLLLLLVAFLFLALSLSGSPLLLPDAFSLSAVLDPLQLLRQKPVGIVDLGLIGGLPLWGLPRLLPCSPTVALPGPTCVPTV